MKWVCFKLRKKHNKEYDKVFNTCKKFSVEVKTSNTEVMKICWLGNLDPDILMKEVQEQFTDSAGKQTEEMKKKHKCECGQRLTNCSYTAM